MLKEEILIVLLLGVNLTLLLGLTNDVLAQPTNLTGNPALSNTTNSSNSTSNDTIKSAFESLKETFGSQFVK